MSVSPGWQDHHETRQMRISTNLEHATRLARFVESLIESFEQRKTVSKSEDWFVNVRLRLRMYSVARVLSQLTLATALVLRPKR